MKEHPIIFQDAMVRALLVGTRTQTRRAIKPQPGPCEHKPWPGEYEPKWVIDADGLHCATCGNGHRMDYRSASGVSGIRCPYGAPGDRLWVREAHWWFKDEHDLVTGYFPPKLTAEDVVYRADGDDGRKVWRPSIHMPRWASRILLEVTEVRVQRLWEISEDDAIAEGVEAIPYTGPNAGPNRYSVGDSSVGWANFPTAREAYAHLWDQINGAGSWDANPWVWAVAFQGLNASALIASEDTEAGA